MARVTTDPMGAVVKDTTDPLDPPIHVTRERDSDYDPVLYWLAAAETSHYRMHHLLNDAYTETKWRKKCIQTALTMGATQQQVADRLGVTREQVSKLAR